MDAATGVGLAVAGATALAALFAWLLPRSPRSEPAVHETVRVEVSNHFPVLDLPTGERELGAHLVAATLRNGTHQSVKVTGWGVRLSTDERIVVFQPTTTWEPRLPHWVQPGDEATWYLDATELRQTARERSLTFDDMRPSVTIADGRSIPADRGVPLA